jgi:RNA polymerase sigma-70 factor, ECF subfamily
VNYVLGATVDQLGEDDQAQTIDLLLAKDKATTERFVRTHSSWMLLLATRILRDRGTAEDVIQNAYINIFKGLPEFDARSSLKTWMHRIVVNQALMELRKKKRRQESSIDDLLPRFDGNGCRIEDQPALQQDSQTPENLLLSKDESNTVLRCIGELPESYRIILMLRDIEELSTSETAKATGLSEINVKVRLHRARAALKKLLDPHYERRER